MTNLFTIRRICRFRKIMNAQKYLEKLKAGGDLLEQLKVHAKEYDGPCGQSMAIMTANQIKKQALLDAAREIEALRKMLSPRLPSPGYVKQPIFWFTVLELARGRDDRQAVADAVRELSQLGIKISFKD